MPPYQRRMSPFKSAPKSKTYRIAEKVVQGLDVRDAIKAENAGRGRETHHGVANGRHFRNMRDHGKADGREDRVGNHRAPLRRHSGRRAHKE